VASRILIVRLGALGDLIHALPALAAMRDAWPAARLDWLVDTRYAALLRYVSGCDRAIVIGRTAVVPAGPSEPGAPAFAAYPGLGGAWRAIRELRAARYDAALDLQGLIKSAALARASGARRVIGFSPEALREREAGVFYTETAVPDPAVHVVRKNLAAVRLLGIEPGELRFSLDAPLSARMAAALPTPAVGGLPRFAILNPGAGWPNKRWPPERFGAVAAFLRTRFGLPSLVTWGPHERPLADAVAAASDGAARVAPETSLGDIIAMTRRAALFVGGDTGPLQMAAALGTPIVSMFGPTNPARNGSWSPDDMGLSRFDSCDCHHKRQCRRATNCIDDISVAEVTGAIERRLGPGA
jgi:lipopolysaccharide heptosyltransferase I